MGKKYEVSLLAWHQGTMYIYLVDLVWEMEVASWQVGVHHDLIPFSWLFNTAENKQSRLSLNWLA